jgi:ATP-dependent RNA helicase DDX10/DBP4
VPIDDKIQSLCAGDVELKESAKRALMAYMRSIFLMSNKKLFKMDSIDLVKYSHSLGLVVAPRIRFAQQKAEKLSKIKEDRSESENEEEGGNGEEFKDKKAKAKKKLLQRKLERESEDLKFNPFGDRLGGVSASLDSDGETGNQAGDGLFTVKRVFNPSKDQDDDKSQEFVHKAKIKIKTKASIVKQIKKKKLQVNEKIHFDDEGNRVITNINQPRSINMTDELAKEINDPQDEIKKSLYGGIDIEEAKKNLRNEDQFDKQLYRDRIKKVHREKRLKEKDARRAKRHKGEDPVEFADTEVTLADQNDDDESDFEDNDT